MASKLQEYRRMSEEAQRQLTGSLERWQSFLATASRLYKYPYHEQVMIHAQRPDATAVLPIEGKNGWNKRFGRWVNRGATGIAVFDGDAVGRSRLKYYFDISDTHESRFARPVPIWTMRPEYEPAVIEALENSFGELADKTDLAAALLSAAKNAVEDNMPDYLTELKYYKENSFLEELDDLNIEVEYRRTLENSIGYMLLARCGIDPTCYFTDDDFRDVVDFSTPETLNALGTATGDIGQMCLSAVSRTALTMQRQNRTFAEKPTIQYPEAEKKTTTPERSETYERTDIHDAGRLPNLLPPQEPEMHLGKYALLRRTYLKQHRRVTFTNLLTSGRLNQHLMEIEQVALSRMELLTSQMAKAEGVTEELKASDPMKWTGLMNNIRHSAGETVLNELICN